MAALKSEGIRSGEVFLSRPDLLSVGCRNCVFLLHGQCFHGLGLGEQFVDPSSDELVGFCPELVDWLFGLAGSSGSSAVLWENYHLFVNRLQSAEDYGNFCRLDSEIKLLESRGRKSAEGNSLEELQMKKAAARLWWDRTSDGLLRGLGRVVDRESREKISREDVHVVHKISLEQIHRIVDDSKRADLISEDKKDTEVVGDGE